jgi:O-acetyl-ADP-ribose deacetylase (regulator of RNase III)
MTHSAEVSMEDMKFIVCVPNDAEEAVRYLFREFPYVETSTADPFVVDCHALVVPHNSFGFFDGGFRLRVADTFGFGLQDELQRRIAERHDGELLVGEAEILPTGRPAPAYAIAAPIVRASTAHLDETVNIYLAARGVMVAIKRNPECAIRTVVFPLAAFLEGNVTPYAATRQIRYGIRALYRDRPRRIDNLSKAVRREKELKRSEKSDD